VTEGGGGQSRAAVAAVRTLANHGYNPLVTVCSHISLARASRYCRRWLAVPAADREPVAYARAVWREAGRISAVAVLPASDVALLALGFPVRHLVDKVTCGKAAADAGFEVPPTQVFESATELLDCSGSFGYPIVIKPDLKRTFARRVDFPDGVRRAVGSILAQPGRVMVQPYLGDVLHGVVGLMWKGSLLLAMHMRYDRLWPAVCGTVASAVTIEPDPQLEQRLERLLAGYEGIFHVEFAGPYLLDVNPRVHATLPLAIAGGVNPVIAHCDLLRGVEVQRSRAKPGVFFRWLEGDFRSVLHDFRHDRINLGQALGACRPRRHAVHSYESLVDPGPAWERFRFLLEKLKVRGPRQASLPVAQMPASVVDQNDSRRAAFSANHIQGQANEPVSSRRNLGQVQTLNDYRAG
jgi:hypothetical protein